MLKNRVEVVDSGVTSVDGRADAVDKCSDLVDDRRDRNVERYMVGDQRGEGRLRDGSLTPRGGPVEDGLRLAGR